MSRAPRDLREFLHLLEKSGELHRVTVEADPYLEIAAVTDRACKFPGGGPALYFERPKGFSPPVLTNLFGSPSRVALALGVGRLEELNGKLAGERSGIESGLDCLARRLTRPDLQARLAAEGPCREITRDGTSLDFLPALQAWPGDGGRYLTLPLVFSRDPSSAAVNCGMYRLQVFADGTLGLHLSPRADAARHLTARHARGEPLPVAVALGGPPALIFAAGLPLPAGVSETALAGLLLGEPLSTTPCRNSDLPVPSAAEVIIEGEIRPGETRLEGPFGNHTGRYVPAAPAALLRVTAVSQRRSPLYPATVVGPPPMEDCWLAKAAERLLLPLLRQDFPQVVDWDLPLETIFHGAALIAARVAPGEGRELLQHLKDHPLLARSRLVVLFDAGVDIRDRAACYWRAVNRVDPINDLEATGDRLLIDATDAEATAEVTADTETRRLVERRWNDYGLPGR
jgi:4-hydroxy-3-polyprenylbenzoate decarboxylase